MVKVVNGCVRMLTVAQAAMGRIVYTYGPSVISNCLP
jgi:hypothetical protein